MSSDCQTRRGLAILREQKEYEQKLIEIQSKKTRSFDDTLDKEWSNKQQRIACKHFVAIRAVVRRTMSMDTLVWLATGKK